MGRENCSKIGRRGRGIYNQKGWCRFHPLGTQHEDGLFLCGGWTGD